MTVNALAMYEDKSFWARDGMEMASFYDWVGNRIYE